MPGPDVVIAGAGPAGSVLALLLAREGLEVRLLDRKTFPRGKACGEVLNPAGVSALYELGLGEAVLSAGPARLVGWDMSIPEGARMAGSFSTTAPLGSLPAQMGLPDRMGLPAQDASSAWGISRSVLDTVLMETARDSGVQVREGVQVVGVESAGKGGRLPQVTLRGDGGGQELLEGRVVVGADGLGSRVSRSLGWARPVRGPAKASFSFRLEGRRSNQERGVLFLGGLRTLGLAPVTADGRRWNATLVLAGDLLKQESDRGRLTSAPEEILWETLERAGVDWTVPPTIVDGPWKSGSFHRPTRRVAGGGVLLVGDAAGYYDPLTGQGISRAIRGAQVAAAPILAELARGTSRKAGRGDPDRGAQGEFRGYPRAAHRLMAPSRRVQKLIEAVLTRPGLRGRMVGWMAGRPGAADALIRVTGDVSPPHSLLKLWNYRADPG
ncbi:MAG: NAD(P)/FAD-dependent oxidoreductase [Gemmatimonadota bacterium]